MMTYSKFYDISEYGNENWKGSFTPREIACNAYDYLVEFQESKAKGKPTHTIIELAKLLLEDGSFESKCWLAMMKEELPTLNRELAAMF